MNMEQRTTVEEEVRRGRQAVELMTHPLLDAAFKNLKEEIVKAWMMSPISATADRETLFLAVNLLDKVRGLMEEHIKTGKLAQKQIEDAFRLKEWSGRVAN